VLLCVATAPWRGTPPPTPASVRRESPASFSTHKFVTIANESPLTPNIVSTNSRLRYLNDKSRRNLFKDRHNFLKRAESDRSVVEELSPQRFASWRAVCRGESRVTVQSTFRLCTQRNSRRPLDGQSEQTLGATAAAVKTAAVITVSVGNKQAEGLAKPKAVMCAG